MVDSMPDAVRMNTSPKPLKPHCHWLQAWMAMKFDGVSDSLSVYTIGIDSMHEDRDAENEYEHRDAGSECGKRTSEILHQGRECFVTF
jgi:hypothetical protein